MAPEEIKEKTIIHIVYKTETQTWHAMDAQPSLLKSNLVAYYSVAFQVKKLLREMPRWMRHFFAFRTLIPFVFDEETQTNKEENIILIYQIANACEALRNIQNQETYT